MVKYECNRKTILTLDTGIYEIKYNGEHNGCIVVVSVTVQIIQGRTFGDVKIGLECDSKREEWDLGTFMTPPLA